MRELDAVLEAFLARSFDTLDARDKSRFAAVLELPDPELHAYLVRRDAPADPDLARLLERIRESVADRA